MSDPAAALSVPARTPVPDAPLQPLSWREQPWAAKAAWLILTLLTAGLVLLLWPHWRDNPELSHAFLTPVLFVYLLREARRGERQYLDSSTLSATTATLASVGGLIVVAVSGLYATALDWSHALVVFTLTVAVSLWWCGALAVAAQRAHRLVPLNWTALAAIMLWLPSAPLPPGTYTRLTLGLQLAVTENVLRALHVLGIAATRHGNVIELATTSVGVEEACSGVRSLISCLFAALLFSATLVRGTWPRVILIGLAGPLAVGMNFLRSLGLTLLANRGVDIAGRWHDVTGLVMLAVTALLLAGLALGLERLHVHALARKSRQRRRGATATDAAGGRDQRQTVRPRAGPAPAILLAGLVMAASLAVFFVVNTRPSVRRDAPLPDLAALLPTEAPGWSVRTSTDLYQFSRTLHTEHLAQRTYLQPAGSGVRQVTVYLAYWRAGQAPASLVASHTPDACWPGSGWVMVGDRAEPVVLTLPERTLPAAEARLFKNDAFPQYVWFWHLYDGRPIAYRDPYSARELLRSAWRFGFSHEGDQLFVRISSNESWTTLANEPLLREIFARLKSQGL